MSRFRPIERMREALIGEAAAAMYPLLDLVVKWRRGKGKRREHFDDGMVPVFFIPRVAST